MASGRVHRCGSAAAPGINERDMGARSLASTGLAAATQPAPLGVAHATTAARARPASPARTRPAPAAGALAAGDRLRHGRGRRDVRARGGRSDRRRDAFPSVGSGREDTASDPDRPIPPRCHTNSIARGRGSQCRRGRSAQAGCLPRRPHRGLDDRLRRNRPLGPALGPEHVERTSIRSELRALLQSGPELRLELIRRRFWERLDQHGRPKRLGRIHLLLDAGQQLRLGLNEQLGLIEQLRLEQWIGLGRRIVRLAGSDRGLDCDERRVQRAEHRAVGRLDRDRRRPAAGLLRPPRQPSR
jgi:hypothetical protein